MSPEFEPYEIPCPVWKHWNPAKAKPVEVVVTLPTGHRVRCAFIGDGPAAKVWSTGPIAPSAGAVLRVTPALCQRLADTAGRAVHHHGQTFRPRLKALL